MKRKRYIVSALVGLLFALSAFSQPPTGTIQGVVQDSTGGLVPDASVLIVNINTNEAKQLRTDSAGRYLQPFLLPGTYAVTVEKEGFRSFKEANIKLDVGQNRSVNFSLELGVVTQEVRVGAAPPALDVNTSSIGQVIDYKRIVDLPLNGRSVLSLANLAPGVNPTGGGHTPGMGGGRNSGSELQIDGVTDIAPENNVGVNLRVYEPQVDSVEEFNVQVNALAAEYGRFTGGVIIVATKSGTNALHGSAYEYLRNSKLDANSFFANRAGRPKGSFKRNQWGGTIGGPILIPKVYDGHNRSFFFFGLEATNARSPSIFTGTVPPPEWRAGDFSNLRTSGGAPITVYDPLTVRADPANPGKYIRSPFTGNRIPADRVDPVAKTVMNYFPASNTPPANRYTYVENFLSIGSPVNDSYRSDMRVDQNWTDRWRMFARFSVRWSNSVPVNHFQNIATPSGDGPGNIHDYHLAVNHTFTLSPTLIGNLTYGFGRRRNLHWPFSDGIDLTSLGFPKYLNEAAARDGKEFPLMQFSGATSSLGQPGYTRQAIIPGVHSLTGMLTKILPRHAVKGGMEYRKLLMNFAQYGYPSSYYSFSPAWTQQEIVTPSPTAGFSFSSFLLGLASGGNITHSLAAASASSYFAGYIQDDWKVTNRLTLNIGLRYDLDRPRTERFNRYSYFNLYEASSIAGRVPASACTACGNLMGAMHFVDENNRRQAPTDKNNFGPRFGFAYNLARQTVIRGAYGIAYASSALQAAGTTGSAGLDGYTSSTNFTSTMDTMRSVYAYLRDPFPAGFNFPPGRAEGASTNLGVAVSSSVFDAFKNPYVQEWNLNIQRSLPGQLVVEVGYLGNHGIGLVDGEANTTYNQLPPSYMAMGSDLLRMVPNPFFGVITNRTSSLSQRTVQYRQLLRAYPQYTEVASFRKPIGNSIYHAMTVRVDKRFSSGVSFLVAYTAGKLIDDCSHAVGFLGPIAGTKLDAYNRRLERSVSSMDVAQRAVFNYLYELPFGKGRRFLAAVPTGVNQLISGWQINGITTFQSGTPLIIKVPVNNTQIYTSSQRPNDNGKPARITGGATDERLARWFDTSVFSQPPSYTFGSTGRTLPDARNPGIRLADLSLFKNTYFGPERRMNLQYRLEMFNAFNTPQFSGPGTTVDTASFGRISGAGEARQIQMALKLIW